MKRSHEMTVDDLKIIRGLKTISAQEIYENNNVDAAVMRAAQRMPDHYGCHAPEFVDACDSWVPWRGGVQS